MAIIPGSSLKGVIRNALMKHFPKAGISAVDVASDFDVDGDKILRIMVVLEDAKDDVNREVLVEATRHLRSKLLEEGNDEFPLLSFVARKEVAKMKKTKLAIA